jgi:lipopolysaccharide export system ATP-binding protein
MADMTLLETCGLVKRYSGRIVVNEVSITIERQTIVGLLGRNGAGKTTSFRMIMGMVTPNSGSVLFEGRDITRLPMYKRAGWGSVIYRRSRASFSASAFVIICLRSWKR